MCAMTTLDGLSIRASKRRAPADNIIDIEGYSYAKVAAQLPLLISTVNSSLFCARVLVRDTLVAARMLAAPPGTVS